MEKCPQRGYELSYLSGRAGPLTLSDQREYLFRDVQLRHDARRRDESAPALRSKHNGQVLQMAPLLSFFKLHGSVNWGRVINGVDNRQRFPSLGLYPQLIRSIEGSPYRLAGC